MFLPHGNEQPPPLPDIFLRELGSCPQQLATGDRNYVFALTEIAKTTLQNVRDFESGKPLANKVI
jgi:hypothetical protein